jgi:hypothetical protein
MLLWNLNKLKAAFGFTIYKSSILTNLIFATHIYTMSITYFVLRFCERFFKTRSIIHVIGTNIYIYSWTCVQNGMDFMDLLAHERNRYRRYLLVDIKHYLSHIAERSVQKSLWAYEVALFVTVLISQTLLFELNVTLTSVFNFIVLLSYFTICVFLVQKFSCPVATHEHAT